MPTKTIPAMPVRTPVVDADGMIDRQWLIALQDLQATGTGEGTPGPPGPAGPTGPTGPPGTAGTGSTPATQLGAGDWSLSVIEYGFGDPTGKHEVTVPCAHVRCTITANPTDISFFSAFVYWGATAPTDQSLYADIGVNQPKAISGPTLIDFWIARPAATQTLWVVVGASSGSYQAYPTNLTLAPHSVTVTQVGMPSQVTAFTAAVYYQNRGGVDCGALAFTWTPPADLEYFAASVYKIDTDSSYTPLAGKTWDLVGNAISGFDQRVLNQWWPTSGIGYVKFKVQSVSRVLDSSGHNLENTVGAPTANLTINASGGLDLSAANALSVGAGLSVAFTTLTAKVSSGIEFDGSGNIVVKNGDGIAIDTSGKVTVNAGVGLQLSGGLITTKPSTGLTADGSGIYIPGGAITNALLAALAVATTNLQAGAVTQTKIANASIVTAHITTAAITTALIANAAITNALLGNAVVGTANIQNAAITDALIANLAVSKLLAGTALFTGDVTFQNASSGSRLVVSSTGIGLASGLNVVQVVAGGVNVITGSDTLSITTNGGPKIAATAGTLQLAAPSGVGVFDGHDFSVTPGKINVYGGIQVVNPGYNALVINVNGTFVGAGVATGSSVSAGDFKVSGTPSINSSNVFVGAGVSSVGYAVNCSAYQIAGGTVIDGSKNAAFIQLTVNGTLGINSSCQFVGNGVACIGSGIGGTGHSTYVPGVGWYFGGGTGAVINIGGTNYFLRGGILCTS